MGGGTGPQDGLLVVDIDSTICEVSGKAKQGAAYGYTKVLGYHPIVASRADTGEIFHARMRKGSANTGRGARRFLGKLIARVRRAGAAGAIVARLDSGFWSGDTTGLLAGSTFATPWPCRPARKPSPRPSPPPTRPLWTTIDYPDDGEAKVAECVYGGRRPVVRRTRLTGAAQAELWPYWRHFAFLTDLGGDAVNVTPSTANTPWSSSPSATSRKDRVSNTSRRGTSRPTAPGCAARCSPTTWSAGPSSWANPGVATSSSSPAPCGCSSSPSPPRLVNRAGRLTRRGPTNWPWAKDFVAILDTLGALQPTTG
ncbi:MAG: transposase [Acidimicrobiales bacterium]